MNAKQLIEAGIEEISDRALEERYHEMLNDCYEPVKLLGYEYLAGDTLAKVDPIVYRCGFADWISSEHGETIIEVDGKYFDKYDVELLEEENSK